MQYKLLRSPSVYTANESYLCCQAEVSLDDGEDSTQYATQDIAVFLVDRTSIPGPLRAGTILDGGEPTFYPDLNALVLVEYSVPKVLDAVPVQAVSQAVPRHTRVATPASENGWGDQDDIIAVAQKQEPPAERVRYQVPKRTPAANAVRAERRRAIEASATRIPAPLLEDLEVTAAAYRLVAKLVGATGNPGPQDVRAMVITNMINWAKVKTNTDHLGDDLAADDLADQLERMLKEQT